MGLLNITARAESPADEIDGMLNIGSEEVAEIVEWTTMLIDDLMPLFLLIMGVFLFTVILKVIVGIISGN